MRSLRHGQLQNGLRFRLERIASKLPCFQLSQPVLNHPEHAGYFQIQMPRRVLLEIGCGELKQSSRGAKAVLLQMNKRAGELNQPFVKSAVRLLPLRQPKFLQHVVRFVEKTTIETLEITKIVRVIFASLAACD